MTRISTPVVRETLTLQRNTPLVIELRARTLFIRLKGARHGYELSYEQIFHRGAEIAANEARRDRAQRRRIAAIARRAVGARS